MDGRQPRTLRGGNGVRNGHGQIQVRNRGCLEQHPPYADSIPVSTNRAPTANDNNYRLGQLWLDTAGTKLYWLKALAANVATWVAVPNDATITAILNDYMAKNVFAKNGGAAAGKVDHALKADALATARKIKVSGDVVLSLIHI